jgi:peptide/nickel transport system substrate-binding protein
MQATNDNVKIINIFFKGIALSMLIFVGLGISDVHGGDILRIGLLQEPKILNVWSASDFWSRKVLDQFYQSLYIREPKNMKLVPWLAKGDPVYNSAGVS